MTSVGALGGDSTVTGATTSIASGLGVGSFANICIVCRLVRRAGTTAGATAPVFAFFRGILLQLSLDYEPEVTLDCSYHGNRLASSLESVFGVSCVRQYSSGDLKGKNTTLHGPQQAEHGEISD